MSFGGENVLETSHAEVTHATPLEHNINGLHVSVQQEYIQLHVQGCTRYFTGNRPLVAIEQFSK